MVADEMFPEGAGAYADMEEAGGSSNLLMDLAAYEKSIHQDFFNSFDNDLFDDDDLKWFQFYSVLLLWMESTVGCWLLLHDNEREWSYREQMYLLLMICWRRD